MSWDEFQTFPHALGTFLPAGARPARGEAPPLHVVSAPCTWSQRPSRPSFLAPREEPWPLPDRGLFCQVVRSLQPAVPAACLVPALPAWAPRPCEQLASSAGLSGGAHAPGHPLPRPRWTPASSTWLEP